MTWTDTRIDTLRRLWADGLTCRQIAAELGGITKSAVIGKADRLGLPERAKSAASGRHINGQRGRARTKKNGQQSIARPVRIKISTGNGNGNGMALKGEVSIVEDLPLPTELSADGIPVGQRKTLFELTGQTCRWPYGDPGTADFFFCGAEDASFPLHPYCAQHAMLSYNRSRYLPWGFR